MIDKSTTKNKYSSIIILLLVVCLGYTGYLISSLNKENHEISKELSNLLKENNGDAGITFKAYEDARYLRTGRVQTAARIYGDIYHASGVVGELRSLMLSGRSPTNYEGVAWLYDGI